MAIGVTKDLESTLIREGDDQTEAMSVQVVVDNLPICVINADVEGHGLIIQMDGNLHAGSKPRTRMENCF